MGKYDSLRDYLAAQVNDTGELEMSFADIEQLVGRLPSSARSHEAWWTNTSGTRAGTQAWRSAGWHVQSVDQAAGQVVFARNKAVLDAENALVSPPVASSNGGPSVSPAATPQASHQQDSHAFRRTVLGDLGIGLVTAAVAGVSGIIGLTHLPWPILAVLSAAAGAVGFTVSQAIASRKAADSARWWWSASTLILVLLCIGAFTYHKSFDPATQSPRTYQFVVDGDQTKFIPLYGEAGGPAQFLATGNAGQNGLIGGQAYNFDCWATGLDHQTWLRYERFGQTWWAPRVLLHPPAGENDPPVPHC